MFGRWCGGVECVLGHGVAEEASTFVVELCLSVDDGRVEVTAVDAAVVERADRYQVVEIGWAVGVGLDVVVVQESCLATSWDCATAVLDS